MHILYLSSPAIPSPRASSLQVFSMCHALAREGHSVQLAAPLGFSGADPYQYYASPREFEWIPLTHARGRAGYLAFSVQAAALACRSPRGTVLYSRDPLSLSLASLSGHRMLLEAHIPPKHTLDVLLFRWLLSHPRLLGFITNTRTLLEHYESRFPKLACSERWKAVYNGGPEFRSVEPRDRWPGREGRLQVGYVGSGSRGKGLSLIEELARTLSEMDFHILGEHRVEKSLSNLHFHGHVARGELDSFWPRFDVVLAPYQRKVESHATNVDLAPWTSSLKVVEYMSAGKAILCSDLPSLREILTHRRNALLLSPDGPTEWIEALIKLSEDRPLIRRLGEQARTDFLDKHTWRSRAREVLRVIR